MNMRDLQDRFFEAQTSRQRIDEELAQCSVLNSGLKQTKNSLIASFALIPSHPLEQNDLLQLVNHHNFNSLLPKTASRVTNGILREPTGYDWQPNAFGIVAKFPINDASNNPTSIWNIRDNGSIHASGIIEMEKISTGEDVEVFPFMISVTARHLISIQTALIKIINLPSLNWYFVCEIKCNKEKVYVRADKSWKGYKPLNLSSPIKIKPIRIIDAFDTSGVDLIEQKICNIFELASDPYGKIISFEN